MQPIFRKKLSRRKRAIALIIIAIAGIFWWWSGVGEAEGPAYEYVPVSKANIEETVTAQGELEPKEFVDVGSQVSGQLQKLHVEIGDSVQKGDLIAEIDPKLYTAQVAADEAQIKTLRAQLAEQEAQVAYTRNVFQRNQRLTKADAVSKEAVEASQMEYNTALARARSYTAQIEQAESQLEADKANLGYTKIYAPMDGTVVSQTSKEGQTLNANQTAPVIVQVANLDTMTAKAQVAEADIARLKVGMPVYFTTLGSERRWESKLRQLLPSPDSTVTDVVLYNALVDVENKDRALMTGMSTQMFFQLGSAKDALTIPARALGKRVTKLNGEGEWYEVMVKTRKGVETREVQVGLLNRTQAQVLSGISEQDQLAIPLSENADAAAMPRRGPRI
jgi:macrolide-specific efflux system membrane fusion protein